MSNNNIDSFAYLGREFQFKVLGELLTDSKFCENIIQHIQSKYFDDDTFKRILIEIKNHTEKYGKVPSIRNNSIYETIRSKISDEIELTTLIAVLDKLKERDENKNKPNNYVPYDGEEVQQKIWLFIKQQEYKNLGNFIIKNIIAGQIDVVDDIEEKIREISKIGNTDDGGVNIFDDIDETLEMDYRNPIPTGLGNDLDELMGGGLGNGEMGFVLAGLGTGKAQPLTAKVLTPNGWKLMGDIEVGDDVISSNGKPTKVLGVYPQDGDRDVYRVEFNDGSVTECDVDHLWSVRLNNNENFEVKEFREIIDLKLSNNIINIPVVKPIELNRIKISNKYKYKNNLDYLGSSLYAYPPDMMEVYINYIIHNSLDYKIKFLKSYFNSKINKQPFEDNLITIVESDSRYLENLYKIIKSIGGVGEYSICNKYKWPKLKFTLPQEIFNKIFDNVEYNLKNVDLYITKIEYKGKEKTQCIYVEDESHEYVTDDYIVTHNTTMLTKIANHAHSIGKNVLQIFFEDNKKQIKRKHYSIWSGVPQSKIDDNVKIIKQIVNAKKEKLNSSALVLVKFPQDENITIPYIKKWIINYQKLHGFKFDMIVLDYIDCVESHQKSMNSDSLSNELVVTKAFEAMLADFDIPGWTATQGNRNSLGAEVVTTSQMGGSIKKAQKSHFIISIARSDEQKERGFANIKILKSRFGRDGITFEDCIFDNDNLAIDIRRNSQNFNVILENDRQQTSTSDIIKEQRNSMLLGS